ncbi:MAG: hypothetical protein ABW321_33350 [Polyangiales bacterium]
MGSRLLLCMLAFGALRCSVYEPSLLASNVRATDDWTTTTSPSANAGRNAGLPSGQGTGASAVSGGAGGSQSASDCSAVCDLAHAAARCRAGQCRLDACERGFADCDGLEANGCERRLDSLRDCGACHNVCRDVACSQRCLGPHVAAADCSGPACTIGRCADGFADCNADAADGCEADLLAADSCGTCGAVCRLPHVARARCDLSAAGDPVCLIDRTCGPEELDCSVTRLRGCDTTYADCDGRADNGCETDLQRLTSCGGCGSTCLREHARTECRGGQCVGLGCEPGYGPCGAGGVCQSLQDDPQHCGACGHTCSAATPACSGGRCTAQRCPAGRADCDGDSANTCETRLDDAASCGGCGVACGPLPHVSAVDCSAGQCAIGRCAPGFADCDGASFNGCEVDLNTANDCGACGKSCSLAHAEARCELGRCTLEMCTDGRTDCNGDAADGCENDLRGDADCGRCGLACDGLPHVAAGSCQQGRCEITCLPGFADCDQDPDNGCEADLSLGRSCGRCGNNCGELAHVASAGCAAGSCNELACDSGWGDCNLLVIDGCERDLQTPRDCGVCGAACAPAHAPADCARGVCVHGPCEPGWGDCDGVAANGCESALDTSLNCGTCGNTCAAGAPCLDGGECGCATDAQCSDGLHCCDSECRSTEGTCFPWPCIPGTNREANAAHCGGCGQACLLFCCGELF